MFLLIGYSTTAPGTILSLKKMSTPTQISLLKSCKEISGNLANILRDQFAASSSETTYTVYAVVYLIMRLTVMY